MSAGKRNSERHVGWSALAREQTKRKLVGHRFLRDEPFQPGRVALFSFRDPHDGLLAGKPIIPHFFDLRNLASAERARLSAEIRITAPPCKHHRSLTNAPGVTAGMMCPTFGSTALPTLIESIIAASAKAKKFGDRRLGEQNTKASLVEPVLEALGWDIRDPDEVHREFRPTGKDSPVDYALKLMRKPRLFLEAKGLGETLGERRWIAQVLGYATVAGVEWCVLTDGDEYRFYNATAPIDAEEKMFCRIRLTETPVAEAANSLSLLSRANLGQNLLEVLWVSHFVDRRVKVALREILATPGKGLTKLVQSQVPKLTPKEIADSIRRLDIRIESPAMAAPAPPKNLRGALGSRNGGAVGRATRKSGVRPQVTLAELIKAGELTPPLRLFRRYKNLELEATLHADGQVEFEKNRYPTCSTAAEVARGTVTGRRMNTNGWVFWQYTDSDGKTRPLDVSRQRFAQSSKVVSTEVGPLRLTEKSAVGGEGRPAHAAR